MIKLTLSKSEEALTLPLHYKDFTRSMVYAILPPLEISHSKTGRTGINVSADGAWPDVCFMTQKEMS